MHDDYFGTYPNAQNNPGETPFKASKHTPINNNLLMLLDVNHAFMPLTGLDLYQPTIRIAIPMPAAGAQQPAA